MSRKALRLSPEPLTGWIARQGGLAEAFMAVGMDPYIEQPEEEVLAEMPPTETPEFRRVRMTLSAGAERGWLGFWWVDEVCCTIFKLHPIELYGDEYLDAEPTAVPTDAEIITLPQPELMLAAA